MNEKRSAARVRVLLSGKIVMRGCGVIDCTLRKRFETGARLKVESVIGIPDSFILLIEPDGGQHAAHVVWRRAAELGVRYT